MNNQLKTIKDVAQELGCSKQNISYHLRKLKENYPDTQLTLSRNRQTLLTDEGVSLIKERISGGDQESATNDKQKVSNIWRQNKDKDDKHLSTENKIIKENQESAITFYQNQLKKKDREIEQLMQIIKEEHQENEKYRHEIIELNLSYQKHTENLLEQFASTVNDQQELLDEFFERTTRLISDQGAQIAEITRTTQKLQQNQQELTLIEHQTSDTPIEIQIKEPTQQNHNFQKDKASWATPVLYLKAAWDVLIKRK